MIDKRDWKLVAIVVVALGVILMATQRQDPPFTALVTFVAGVIAYVGALRQADTARDAADRQVAAANRQIAAMENQLADVQAARREDEEFRREVERAYVSGGGGLATRISVGNVPPGATEIVLNGRPVYSVPTGEFQLHINNHGKTPAFSESRGCRVSRPVGASS